MTDAPERIWIDEKCIPPSDKYAGTFYLTDDEDHDIIQYVRADIYEAAIARAEAAEAERDRDKLRRLVEFLNAQNAATSWGATVGARDDEIKRIRAALK